MEQHLNITTKSGTGENLPSSCTGRLSRKVTPKVRFFRNFRADLAVQHVNSRQGEHI